MDNSSKGSSLSLTESEPYVHPHQRSTRYCESNRLAQNVQPLPGNKHQKHIYNTRLSASLSSSTNRPLLKELYVDLSSSRIDEPHEDLQLVPQTWENNRQRRQSTASEDSREFDFRIYSYPEPFETGNKIMDDRNPCNPRRNNWMKYFVLLSLTAILYIYIQLISNTDHIKRIHKDMNVVKAQLIEFGYKLKTMDVVLTNIKYEQDKYKTVMKAIISQEIEKFSSDKTGKTDFALESTGGKIIQLSPGTENFEHAVTLFGVALCDGKHGPRAMIQADMSPGHCWAIKGTSGGAIIKLIGKVQINAVSMEHISKSLSPTGEISSGPRNFSVWGLKHPSDRGQPLGEFTYNINGALVQTFKVSNTNYYEYVEFRVLTNQGNPDFTCIYRESCIDRQAYQSTTYSLLCVISAKQTEKISCRCGFPDFTLCAVNKTEFRVHGILDKGSGHV